MAASATVGILRVLLSADSAEYQAGVAKAASATQQFTKDIKAAGTQSEAVSAAMGKAFTKAEEGTRGLSKAVASLIGFDAIEKANTYAKAVEAIGGVSKLTAAEQSKLSGIIGDATAKYAALGKAAPASLQSLASSLSPVGEKATLASKGMALLTGSVAQLASGFAIGNLISSAASSLLSFTKASIESAGHILDLSNKTGLSTDSIQKMDAAAALTSSSLEAFTTAAFKLGANISGGKGSVRQAVEDLGLSWQDVRKMGVDQQFETIARALGGVENAQRRNEDAIKLFGKGAGEILPAISEGWDKIADGAHKASREQLEAIDAMSDAWDLFVKDRQKDITSTLGQAAVIAQAAGRAGVVESAKTLAAIAAASLAESSSLFGAAKGFVGGVVAATKPAKTTKPAEVVPPVEQVESYTKALREAEIAVAKLSMTTIEEVMAAEKLGKSNDEIINRFGITEEMLSLLKERYADHKKAIAEAAAEQKKFTEAQDHLSASSQDLVGQQRETVAWLLKRGNSEADIARALHVTAVQVKEVATVEKGRTDALKLADKQAQDFVDHQRKVMDASTAGIVESVVALGKLNDQLALQGTSGLNRQLAQIEMARAAEIRSIKNVGDVESGITKQRRAAIDEFYDHQVRVALGTADTLVERMHASGILTRSELKQQADAFKRDYDQMLASGLYTTEQLGAAWQRYQQALKKVTGDLTADWLAVGSALEHVGGMIPGVFGVFIGNIGSAVNATVAMHKAIDDFNNGLINTAGLIANVATNTLSYLGIIQAAIKLITRDELGGQSAAAIAQRGGKAAISTAALTAGLDSSAGGLLTTRSLSAFNIALAQFDKAVADSNARLQKYGLTWKDLGDTIQQANIDQQTRQLILDFRALGLAGVDVTKRLDAMSGGLSQLVIDAVQTGQKIPAALQPMLETLIRSGKLSEEAARALLGMSGQAVVAFKDVEAAAGRYGIKVEQLGKAVNQLRINDIAKQIIDDWTLLQSAGADTNTVLVGMQKSVQDLVTEALKAGFKIPEGMKPIIKAMIEAGLLIDDNGNKLTDFGSLEFEKPLSQSIDDLIAKLQDLIDAFSKVGTSAEEGFGRARGAAEATGQAVPRGSTGTGGGTATPAGGTGGTDSTSTPPTGTSGTGTSAPKRRFAGGGIIGRVLDFPAPAGADRIPVMAAEGEGIVNADAMRVIGREGFERMNREWMGGGYPASADAGSGGVSVTVSIAVNNPTLQSEAQISSLKRVLEDAVVDVLHRENATNARGVKTIVRRMVS
jgi:hypothetical protein